MYERFVLSWWSHDDLAMPKWRFNDVRTHVLTTLKRRRRCVMFERLLLALQTRSSLKIFHEKFLEKVFEIFVHRL